MLLTDGCMVSLSSSYVRCPVILLRGARITMSSIFSQFGGALDLAYFATLTIVGCTFADSTAVHVRRFKSPRLPPPALQHDFLRLLYCFFQTGGGILNWLAGKLYIYNSTIINSRSQVVRLADSQVSAFDRSRPCCRLKPYLQAFCVMPMLDVACSSVSRSHLQRGLHSGDQQHHHRQLLHRWGTLVAIGLIPACCVKSSLTPFTVIHEQTLTRPA